ncbi:pyrokinin-1 receptor [Leptinotarsa decemlineata]|uniref:pyrokinin-1 receptor n=1 Tax=Leptinotarsa decemlineata TaxID=7539 RepID=UPI003D304BFF
MQSSLHLNQSRNFFHNISSIFTTTSFSVTPTEDWGPKRDPLYIVLPITTIYIVIFFSGVLGNISTCIVIAKNKCMHTATNYYLFSLAISDLLLLTSGLPLEIYSIWSKYPYVFGEEFCILQGLAAETSANATVLTITAFTIERYVAICFPFLSHKLSKLNRAIKYIVYIWIVATCLAIPQAISFGVVCEVFNDQVVAEHCICMVKRTLIPHAFEISTVLFFVAPMTLITVLYILIGVQLRETSLRNARGGSVRMKRKVYKSARTVVSKKTQTHLQECEVLEEEGRKNFSRNCQAAKHVVEMLVAVVVAFFICWAPFHAQRLLAIYGEPTTAHMIKAFKILTYVSGVLYYLSTTVNPVLYHIMSNKFREAFRNTYKHCFSKRSTSAGCKFYSAISARSSQMNSHSSDSCTQSHRSLRYLEAEMANFQENRRPLVVNFRRKRGPPANRLARPESKSAVALDSQVINRETAFDFRTEKHRAIIESATFCSLTTRAMAKDFSFGEVHTLQPEHICPLRKTLVD